MGHFYLQRREAQLDLSLDMLDIISSKSDFVGVDGMDCRSYGLLEGIAEYRELFGELKILYSFQSEFSIKSRKMLSELSN